MLKEYTVCDFCEKMVIDLFETSGWILINDSISITQGRDKEGHAITKSHINNTKYLHFCGTQCLNDFIIRKVLTN